MNSYEHVLKLIREQNYLTNRQLNEYCDILQELIDKTTMCGLPMEEACDVIEAYKELKYKYSRGSYYDK